MERKNINLFINNQQNEMIDEIKINTFAERIHSHEIFFRAPDCQHIGCNDHRLFNAGSEY